MLLPNAHVAVRHTYLLWSTRLLYVLTKDVFVLDAVQHPFVLFCASNRLTTVWVGRRSALVHHCCTVRNNEYFRSFG
jgi:hypothetical protein